LISDDYAYYSSEDYSIFGGFSKKKFDLEQLVKARSDIYTEDDFFSHLLPLYSTTPSVWQKAQSPHVFPSFINNTSKWWRMDRRTRNKSVSFV